MLSTTGTQRTSLVGLLLIVLCIRLSKGLHWDLSFLGSCQSQRVGRGRLQCWPHLLAVTRQGCPPPWLPAFGWTCVPVWDMSGHGPDCLDGSRSIQTVTDQLLHSPTASNAFPSVPADCPGCRGLIPASLPTTAPPTPVPIRSIHSPSLSPPSFIRPGFV